MALRAQCFFGKGVLADPDVSHYMLTQYSKSEINKFYPNKMLITQKRVQSERKA